MPSRTAAARDLPNRLTRWPPLRRRNEEPWTTSWAFFSGLTASISRTTVKEKVFPKLVEGRSVRTPIRIWVPGCSTGEEVYSLAICLYEFLEENGFKAPVQFFGTDLVERHVEKARSGIYP